MFLKTNQKERNKLIIPQLKSRQNSKGKSAKRQYTESNDYQTDQKRNLNQSQQSFEQLRQIISNCNNCKSRMSQFMTKKPSHSQEKAVQTIHKPFLIDLIEERVESICRQNAKLNKLIEQRQEELMERQHEINQIQDKFTSILLSLSQQIAHKKRKSVQWHELKKMMGSDSDTPAYLKALNFQNEV